MRRRLTHVLLTALILLLPAGDWAYGDVPAAQNAYHAGRYRVAMELARPLAESGHAEAQYLVGVMLETGKGVSRDVYKAVTWYRRAAEQDHLEATKRLALINFSGEFMWTSKVRAVLWFRSAAQLGDVPSQGFMGRIYENGWGVAADEVEALMWFIVATHNGNQPAAGDRARLERRLDPQRVGEARRRAAKLLQIDPARLG